MIWEKWRGDIIVLYIVWLEQVGRQLRFWRFGHEIRYTYSIGWVRRHLTVEGV